MSKQGNQNPIARAEYQTIKRALKTDTVTKVASTSGRSPETIRKIRRSGSWTKFVEMNKAIQTKAAKKRQVVKSDKPLAATLQQPERRSKAHAKEVLDLKTQLEAARAEVAGLRAANDMLNETNEELNKLLEQAPSAKHVAELETALTAASNRANRHPIARFFRAFGKGDA